MSNGKVVPIHAFLNTYRADLSDNRYAAIKGKTGTYIELIETPAEVIATKLGFYPIRRKMEKFLEAVFFRKIKNI